MGADEEGLEWGGRPGGEEAEYERRADIPVRFGNGSEIPSPGAFPRGLDCPRPFLTR